MGGAIHHVGNIHKYARREDVPEKTMFIITTDGYENASRRYNYETVRRMIQRQKEKYGWEFLFLGANIDAAREAARFGIGADRSVNYKCDEAGTALNYEVISEAVCSVRAAGRLAPTGSAVLTRMCRKEGGKRMFGAIIGDIVGSRFEFDNCKSKEFELFTNTCDYTDDTVMTLAVAKALLLYGTITDMDAFKRELVRVMHEVGMLHPYCGYGGRFCTWMMKNDTEPYGSFGNGSAMRVSPVAWFAGSLDACEKLAAATAEVTHNHPEGIKGAVVVAGAIYLARMGRSMAEIREYAERFYPIDFTLDEIRPDYDFVETCQGSVPQALESFFESTGFEDAIRNAVSIGGDSDTIADMAGTIAEAYYGADPEMKSIALSYLDQDLLDIAEEFERRIILKA